LEPEIFLIYITAHIPVGKKAVGVFECRINKKTHSFRLLFGDFLPT